MKKKLIRFLIILGSAILIAGIIAEIKIHNKNKILCKNCNILLISLDTLSANHLPCYGYDKNTAPSLCQFAKDNIFFPNSYSQSHWTRPSQTSVFTGLHLTTHGVEVPYVSKLDKKYKTIAETLKGYNYATYYFGPPIDNSSWDESVVKGFDYDKQGIYKINSLKNWQMALDILEQNQRDKKPTFMFLHTYYVHSPYIVGNEKLKFINDEDKRKDIPLDYDSYYAFTLEMEQLVLTSLETRAKRDNSADSAKVVNEMLSNFKKAKTHDDKRLVFQSFSPNEIESFARVLYFKKFKEGKLSEYAKSLYDERIYQLDTEIKDFLTRVKDKFDKDTIVIIYADHGETLGERGRYGHCESYPDCLYMETIRVPLIIKVPGIKNKKINKLAQGIDIYPTIMKLIGKDGPQNLEGEDLFNIKKDYVIAESQDDKTVIIDKKWSLLVKSSMIDDPDQIELYDLMNDKNQLVNVAQKYPKVTAIRINILKKYIMDQGKKPKNEYVFPDWVDEVKKEKIIKEGYF